MWDEIRIKQLEDNIMKDMNLLNKFEDEIRYATSPRIIEGFEREIKRQRESMERYQKEYRELLLSRYDTKDRPVVSVAINRLERYDQDEMFTIGNIFNAIDSHSLPEKELLETLNATRQVLSEIKQKELAAPELSDNVKDVSKMLDDPKLDNAHKFKISLPIIPMILSYETQIELKGELNLRKVWDGIKAMVRGK